MNNGSRSAYWGDQDINLDALNGNRAVVTGGAQGLGLAIAASLGRTGARIVLADIDVERADCEAATLRKQGLCAEAMLLDISDSSSVQSFFRRLDSLDILVNNAGVQQRVCAIADL